MLCVWWLSVSNTHIYGISHKSSFNKVQSVMYRDKFLWDLRFFQWWRLLLWVLMPCGLIDTYQRFRAIYSLYLQGWSDGDSKFLWNLWVHMEQHHLRRYCWKAPSVYCYWNSGSKKLATVCWNTNVVAEVFQTQFHGRVFNVFKCL